MEPKFLTELDTRDLDDNRVMLLADLKYQSAILGEVLTVPRGFVSDKASVPRVPVFYMLYGDRAHRGAIVHDYLYQHHKVGKAKADKVFLEAMKSSGKQWWVRWPMYLGVVIGGWTSYASGPDRYTVLNGGK